MYVLLHRAIRNAGDFLIHERALRLIRSFRPGVEVLSGDASRPIAEQLPAAAVRGCRAIIVAGGPGYRNGMPELYPFGRLLREGPPFVLLALGSHIVPGTVRQLRQFRFDGPTRGFLDAVSARSPHMGARDALTSLILQANGYERVLMTGDPAWYDLDLIEAAHRAPSAIGSIAVTPPASRVYYEQAERLFDRLASANPTAKVTMVCHRGVQRHFAEIAHANRWDTLDISGGAGGFAIYDAVDLHVGYRVHAHLYCTSRSTASYLVAEDSRGIGVHRTLGELGAVAFSQRTDRTGLLAAAGLLPRLATPHRALTSWVGRAALRVPDLDLLTDQISSDAVAGFPRHAEARNVIRRTLPVMRQMIESLP